MLLLAMYFNKLFLKNKNKFEDFKLIFLFYSSPLSSQVKSVAFGSIMAPQVPARSSLKLWFWTALLGRVWFALRSRWTARASGSTASPSRPTTAERDPTE